MREGWERGRGGFIDGRSPPIERPSEGRGGAMINQIRQVRNQREGWLGGVERTHWWKSPTPREA